MICEGQNYRCSYTENRFNLCKLQTVTQTFSYSTFWHHDKKKKGFAVNAFVDICLQEWIEKNVQFNIKTVVKQNEWNVRTSTDTNFK